jgi:hypothetical protein
MTDIMGRFEHFHVADWLSLAAAPTFALMAVLTGILDSGAHQMACSATMHMSPLTGMVPMYVLMSGFHFTPWLKLISRWAKRRTGPSCAVREPRFARGEGHEAARGFEPSLQRSSATFDIT